MTNGIPLPKADDLFNRLADVKIEDIVEAQRIVREAQLLNRQSPGDFTTKVAFAEALLLTGQREKAVEQLEGAFSIRDRSQYAVMDRLAMLLMFIADRDRALRTVEDVAFEPGIFDLGGPDEFDATLGSNHAQIAAWAVDLDLLRRLLERDTRAGTVGSARYYCDLLSEMESVEDVAVHQRLLTEVMRDVQVAVCFIGAYDASGSISLINNVLFDNSAISRRDLERQVASAVSYRLGDKLDGIVMNVLTAAPAPFVGRLKVITGGVAASS